MPATSLDILAIAAHRDDVEQTCGGTLLKMAQRGQKTGILDLTQGEMGTRGSAEDRADSKRQLAASSRYSRRPCGEYLGKSSKSRERDSRDAPTGCDPAILERAPSRSLHLFRAGIRSVLSRGTGQAGDRHRAPSSFQNRLRHALLRRASHVRGRHHAALRREVRVDPGVQVPVQRSGSWQGPLLTTRFTHAWNRWPDSTARWAA